MNNTSDFNLNKKKCKICSELKELKDLVQEKSRPTFYCFTCLDLLKQNKRKCSCCKEVKELDSFAPAKHGKSKTRGICRICTNKQRREWRKNHPQRDSVTTHKWACRHPQRVMYYSCKSRAKKNNIPFNLDFEDIIIPEKCPVLGIEIKINRNMEYPLDNSPSLDKIKPELGYVKGNIKVISFKANSIKSYGTADEHEKIAKYIRENS